MFQGEHGIWLGVAPVHVRHIRCVFRLCGTPLSLSAFGHACGPSWQAKRILLLETWCTIDAWVVHSVLSTVDIKRRLRSSIECQVRALIRCAPPGT
jgi:hypothetical protein